MEKRELVCITCPLGCMLSVQIEDQKIISVTGNTCKRGEAYAMKEITNPSRMVTSIVVVEGGDIEMVSVKTRSDIPKGKIKDCMKELKGLVVKAPVHIGDIIKANVAGTGIDIIATKHVLAK